MGYCCNKIHILKMKVAWAALALASVLMPEAWGMPHSFKPKDYKEKKCKRDEILMTTERGEECFKKGPPLFECSWSSSEEDGEERGESECKALCEEDEYDQKDCADLVHCNLIEGIGGVCNDLKKCKDDKDCGPLEHLDDKKSADRHCVNKGKGKKCYFTGDFEYYLDGYDLEIWSTTDNI